LTKILGYKPRPSLDGFIHGMIVALGFVPRQMIVLEFKGQGKTAQYSAIDEAIKTAQFVRNKCIRYWMDNSCVGQKELYRYES
jgi:hypothetical protein